MSQPGHVVRALELQQAALGLGEAAAGHAVLVEAPHRVQQVEVRQRASTATAARASVMRVSTNGTSNERPL